MGGKNMPLSAISEITMDVKSFSPKSQGLLTKFLHDLNLSIQDLNQDIKAYNKLPGVFALNALFMAIKAPNPSWIPFLSETAFML